MPGGCVMPTARSAGRTTCRARSSWKTDPSTAAITGADGALLVMPWLVFWANSQDVAQQRQRPGGLDPVPGGGGQFSQGADGGGGAPHPLSAGV